MFCQYQFLSYTDQSAFLKHIQIRRLNNVYDQNSLLNPCVISYVTDLWRTYDYIPSHGL